VTEVALSALDAVADGTALRVDAQGTVTLADREEGEGAS
jgi:hypothetical protein